MSRGARPQTGEDGRSRAFPTGLVVLVLFATLLGALVFFGRRQPTTSTPPPDIPVVAGPERVLTIKPGDREQVVLRMDLPLAVPESASLSVRTTLGIRQNDWEKSGVFVEIAGQTIETVGVPVWYLKERSGQRSTPGIVTVTSPPNLPRGFNPALLRDLGVVRDVAEVVKTGALTEQEFRQQLEKTGRSVTSVEQSRIRLQRAKVTLTIGVPFTKKFEGAETGTGSVSLGTQKFLLDTGSAGISLPVDCWVQLPLVQTRNVPGLLLVRPEGAAWTVVR